MPLWVFLLVAPEHNRAKNNREYYMELLRNRTLTSNTENSDLKLIPVVIKNENLNIKNQRPKDYLEEREVYEQLCRETDPKVKNKLQ